MIRAYVGDITKVDNVEYICNAANGVGPMGRGVALAIKNAGGTMIQSDAYRVCKEQDPQPGEVYVTTAGKMSYNGIIHLVTMKTLASPTSYKIIEKCLVSLINYCIENNIKSVALPALGTGVGKLDYEVVADIYKEILAMAPDIEFVIVDIVKKFIDCFE